MKQFFITLLTALCLTLVTLAQDPKDTNETAYSRPFWVASLPGGSYMVALDKITAISTHNYVLDNAIIVTEVIIDTEGASIARFYQISPLADFEALGIQGLLDDAVDEAADLSTEITGFDPTTMVQKEYPTTTHAGTVEFRLRKLSQLKSLYKSATGAWERNKGRKFSIGG